MNWGFMIAVWTAITLLSPAATPVASAVIPEPKVSSVHVLFLWQTLGPDAAHEVPVNIPE